MDENICQPYKCPNCGLQLELRESSWKCGNSHSFDVAKDGYVNLILANKKKSLISGDSKEMILAREEFLNLGYYDFLVGALLKLKPFKKKLAGPFLEIGCGSGFYLNKIARKILSEEIFGTDVSKEAVKFCAKRYKNYHFSVDNSFDLNFLDNSFGALLSIFSPFKSEEIERVLAKEGFFIMVRAGKGHLKELYEKIGMPEKEKSGQSFEKLELLECHDLVKTSKISETDLALLIGMSPLVWKIDVKKSVLSKVKKITFSFKVSVYRKL